MKVKQLKINSFRGISNLTLDFEMTLEKEGQKLIVNQLSDGEKCLLAMVGDLARRLATAWRTIGHC